MQSLLIGTSWGGLVNPEGPGRETPLGEPGNGIIIPSDEDWELSSKAWKKLSIGITQKLVSQRHTIVRFIVPKFTISILSCTFFVLIPNFQLDTFSPNDLQQMSE